jgi:hypothetical protein
MFFMNHIKKLAFADSGKVQRPERKKVLYFKRLAPPLIILASFSACSNAHARLNMENPRDIIRTAEQPRQKDRCTFDQSEVLEQGERVQESVCRENDILVLTNTSLLRVNTMTERHELDEGMTFRFRFSRTDLREILSRGLVDWAHAGETIYFLTSDSRLTLIPLSDMGETIPRYRLPFTVNGASMVHFDDRVFIAPVHGDAVMLTIGDSVGISRFPLGFDGTGSDFHVLRGSLYFGDPTGVNVEITRNGIRR